MHVFQKDNLMKMTRRKMVYMKIIARSCSTISLFNQQSIFFDNELIATNPLLVLSSYVSTKLDNDLIFLVAIGRHIGGHLLLAIFLFPFVIIPCLKNVQRSRSSTCWGSEFNLEKTQSCNGEIFQWRTRCVITIYNC